jgi:hypothetical protein
VGEPRRAGEGSPGSDATKGANLRETNDRKTRARFVQIATSVQGGEILLYALDEAGDVWRFDDKTRQWVMLSSDRR